MTRVMIAVDGSELDAPLARTAHRHVGDAADDRDVDVQGGASALSGDADRRSSPGQVAGQVAP